MVFLLTLFLYPDKSKGQSEEIDFQANGFKIRTTDSDVNTANGLYVYSAFAEYPFGGDGVTPATAF